MTNETTITRPNNNTTHHTNGTFTCKSANLIYLITCTHGCPNAWYIGETRQKLHERLNGHRETIRHAHKRKYQPELLKDTELAKPITPVGDHFSKLNHTHMDIRLTVMQGNLRDDRTRKVQEQKYIKQFNTHKNGLNKDLAFMSQYTD